MQGFEYPTKPHSRRHGPTGYDAYESYREWLRDEFMFRCVYCLHRERWYGRGATFEIDHLAPVAVHPDRSLEYSNLFYACSTCNTAKRALLGVPNPCNVAFAECVIIREDGQVEALNDSGQALVQKLLLRAFGNNEIILG
jgi:hypothetical protein